VGTHQDPIQRAVVLVLAVVCALLNGAFDALVGIAVHKSCLLFFFGFGTSMGVLTETIQEKLSNIAFSSLL